jgi:hypothetical protein
MGFLIALALVLGACYAPEVHDCVLACAADNDCVQGQVCTADHWCAAPALAGGCVELSRDAGVDAPGPGTIDLHIQIDGPGTVTITGGNTCDSTACTFPIAKNVPAVLTAAPKGSHPFDRWTSTICTGQPAVCTFTPTADSTVAAKFH